MPDYFCDAQLAAELGVSVAALCRSSLRLLVRLTAERAALAALEGIGEAPARSCVVCGMPRRPDPIEDSLAHVQCDTIIARLGEELTSV